MDATPHTRRTRLAVFGSVAAERPAPEQHDGSGASPAVGAVLAAVQAGVATRAAAIARPIVDRAVGDGEITRTERRELLRGLDHPSPIDAAPAGWIASRGIGRVRREVLTAIHAATLEIAAPILDAAVASERLTLAQRQRILVRLRVGPGVAPSPSTRPAQGVS